MQTERNLIVSLVLVLALGIGAFTTFAGESVPVASRPPVAERIVVESSNPMFASLWTDTEAYVRRLFAPLPTVGTDMTEAQVERVRRELAFGRKNQRILVALMIQSILQASPDD